MNRSLGQVVAFLAVASSACSAPAPTSRDPEGGGGSSGGAQPVAGGTGQAPGGATGSGGSAGSTPSGGSAGNSASGGSAGSTPSGGSSGLESAEARLYRLTCLPCHGQLGTGIHSPMNLGPEIQHPMRDHTRWVVRNGYEGVGYEEPMEPWFPVDQPDQLEELILGDAEMELIFDFLDKPPQPATGMGLYVDYCGNCHGADGKGGPSTRPVNTAAALTTLVTVTRQGAHPGEQSLRTAYMPAFDQTVLSDAQLQLIADYIALLPP